MRRPERTSHEEARVAETLKKGSRVTGAARDKLAADLKKKYDAGASIDGRWPRRPAAPTDSCTAC